MTLCSSRFAPGAKLSKHGRSDEVSPMPAHDVVPVALASGPTASAQRWSDNENNSLIAALNLYSYGKWKLIRGYVDCDGKQPLFSRSANAIREKIFNCLKPEAPHSALRTASQSAKDAAVALKAMSKDVLLPANILGTTVKKSKYHGVVWHPGNNAWLARHLFEGHPRLCEYHHAEEDAARAYDQMCLKVGKPAINFPPVVLTPCQELDLSLESPKSQYANVSYVKSTGRWKAAMTYNSRTWVDSVFDTELQAAWAAKDAYQIAGRERPRSKKFPTGARPSFADAVRCPLGGDRIVRRKLNAATTGFATTGYAPASGPSISSTSRRPPLSYVGCRVRKLFADGYFLGTIDAVHVGGVNPLSVPGAEDSDDDDDNDDDDDPDPSYFPGLGDEGVTYFHVTYDDGDGEDIEECELVSILWEETSRSCASVNPDCLVSTPNCQPSAGSSSKHSVGVVGVNGRRLSVTTALALTPANNDVMLSPSVGLVPLVGSLSSRISVKRRYNTDIMLTDRITTDSYVLENIPVHLHQLYNASEDLTNRPNLESTHLEAANSWNLYWHGGPKSYFSYHKISHIGPFSPFPQDVKAFALFIVSSGTVGINYLRKIFHDLHCHWRYTHPDGKQDAANSPFCDSPWLREHLQVLQKKIHVLDDVLPSSRAALRPSVVIRIKDKTIAIMNALKSAEPLLGQWDALLAIFRASLVLLFMYTFGPRAVNAYLLKLNGGLAVCPDTGSIIFYHPREYKRTRHKGETQASIHRRALPTEGEWAPLLLQFIQSFTKCREDDAKAKGKPLPAQFFSLAGETLRNADDASQEVTKWMKRSLLQITNVTADMAFDEKLSSHSLREGAASALYFLNPNILFVKWWFAWSPKSDVPEASYIKCHHWDKKEAIAAQFFFGCLKSVNPEEVPLQVEDTTSRKKAK
jgi:hypothetical protein